MKIYYDFHIHTALSPCSDDDMTPNNIVNMAKIKELDVIAITDHNSCKNVEACMKVGTQVGILVIPGVEVQTKEEVHLVCLFRDLNTVYIFQEYADKKLPNISNKPNIFGNQIIYNEFDEAIGVEERLLLNSLDATIDEVFEKVKELDGVVIPAHIDKDTYSIISNLGFMPDYLDINTVEYSSFDKLQRLIKNKIVKNNLMFLKNSDAHNLGHISERENFLEVEELSIDAIIDRLK